ncbi:hypothetical protein CI109_101193 [Kwoniella shandongensis]|uniref:Uncharacterized protein n=1 Tax=Kwoniella shandongensis TaxID=1734106 RepID=A0A5M6BVE4_9TREE|nr:uncharacterized protein CI109_005489 [Kwoniella shandongensis]KAA5526211.1 hypothetical protein CI109_005489 [Kwoniella shandongensis]
MFTTTILFSVLTVIAQAAPLPMPAVKQSNKLASRFYNHPESILYHQTPCWQDGLEGVLQDDICVLAALDIGTNRYAHGYQPGLVSGQPCTHNGRQGIWQDTTCILANVDINLEKRSLLSSPSYLPNEPCVHNGQRGYYRDGLCDILDLNLDLDLNDGPGYITDGRRPVHHYAPVAGNGNDCWLNGRQGFWRDNLCILADLNIAKRHVPYQSEGLVGEVVDTLTGSHDYRHPHYPHSSLPINDDSLLSANALLEVIPTHSLGPRNGLLHNAPDGKILDGAVRTVSQVLDHTATKRGLLGDGDNLLGLGGERRPIYASEYYHRHQYSGGHLPEGELIGGVEAALDVDIDAGDEPYYGPGAHHHVAGLPIKRDLLDDNAGGLEILSSITGALLSNDNNRYVNPHTIHSAYPGGAIIPFSTNTGTDNVLAQVDVDGTLNLDNDSGSRYYRGGNVLGSSGLLGGSGGLIKKSLGGLDNVNGLGLDKLTALSKGDMPVVGDLLNGGSGVGKKGGDLPLPIVGDGKKGGLVPGLL